MDIDRHRDTQMKSHRDKGETERQKQGMRDGHL